MTTKRIIVQTASGKFHVANFGTQKDDLVVYTIEGKRHDDLPKAIAALRGEVKPKVDLEKMLDAALTPAAETPPAESEKAPESDKKEKK